VLALAWSSSLGRAASLSIDNQPSACGCPPTKQPTTAATQTNDQQALYFRPSTANLPNRPTADFVKPARMSRRYDSRVSWSLLQLHCNPSGRKLELGDDEEAYPCRT
jgi:hypothetical protein